MGSLLAHSLPLALGAAISPVLLVTVVLLLTGKKHPRESGPVRRRETWPCWL